MHRFGRILPLVLLSSLVVAQPSDPSVMSGCAAFDNQGSTLNIQSPDKTIINWKSFSISEGERARFVLPDSKAAVLNRVIGTDMSNLLGTLASNGHVFLINPKGILIGPNGLIDTASFIASTLDFSDENFLAGGTLLFKGDSQASIVNLGTIHAWDGDAMLIGYHIDNQGEMNASNGLSGIAAGKEVLIKPSGEERIFICAQVPEGARSENGIDHSGVIQAISSEIKADGNLYSLAINYTGKVEATGAEYRDGKVFLVADKGYIEFQGTAVASNADGTGGEVRVLGETVHLDDSAVIDVSGDFSGGTALIGGNYQGKNTPGPSAQMLYVEKNAQVHADALVSGDGGLAVFWSDKDIVYLGNASARGGEESGNGGTIEVSSRGAYTFSGLTNTLAPNGHVGLLLLDPTNITISNAATTPAAFGGPPPPPFGAVIIPVTCGPANIMVSDLLTALATSNVTVETGAVACIGQNGDITVDDPIIRSDSHILVLDAGGDVTLNAGILLMGTTALIAGDTGGGGAGSITINAPISTFNGSIALTTGGVGGGGSGDIDILSSIMTLSGDITMTTGVGGGNINLTSTGTTNVEVSSVNQFLSGITITFNGPGSLTVAAFGSLSAQLGSTAPTVNCDITVVSDADTNATNVNVLGGSAPGGYAQIGHSGGTSIAGAISITNNDGDITVQGGTDIGTYAQIGHAPSTISPTTIDGSVTIFYSDTLQTENININGGSASGAYALIGMGGQVTPRLTLTNPSGVIPVNVQCIQNLTMTGGSDVDTYAAIGVTGSRNVTFTPPPGGGAAYAVYSQGDSAMTMQSGTGPLTSGAYVGYFLYDGVGAIVLPPSPSNFLDATLGSFATLTMTSSAGSPSAAAGGIDAAAGAGDVGVHLLASGATMTLMDGGSTNPTGGVFLQDGIGNPLNHSSSTSTTIFVGSGGFMINSSATSSAYVNATGTLETVVFGGDMTMTGMPGFPAYINAPNGSILADDLFMQTNAFINVPATGSGLLTIISFLNTSITDDSFIQNLSPTGSLTIVIDAIYPTPPFFPPIGPSTFTLDNTSFISVEPSNQLRIYTARYSQNTIQGTLNGVNFTGTEFVNDAQNEYSTFYPAGGFDNAFPFYRVYYKEPGFPVPVPVPPQIVVIPRFHGVPDLQLYDQMEIWAYDFNISYDKSLTPSSLLSKEQKLAWSTAFATADNRNFLPLELFDLWSSPFPINILESRRHKFFTDNPSTKRITTLNFLSSQQVIGMESYSEYFKKHLMNQDPL